MSRAVKLLILGLLAAIGFGLWTTAHSHGEYDWIRARGYKNASGALCCGVRDCYPVAAEDALRVRLGERFVLPDGRMVVVSRIYASEDARSWACVPGCLFRPEGT